MSAKLSIFHPRINSSNLTQLLHVHMHMLQKRCANRHSPFPFLLLLHLSPPSRSILKYAVKSQIALHGLDPESCLLLLKPRPVSLSCLA